MGSFEWIWGSFSGLTAQYAYIFRKCAGNLLPVVNRVEMGVHASGYGAL